MNRREFFKLTAVTIAIPLVPMTAFKKHPKTFNWTKKPYRNIKGVYLMCCYYTRSNGHYHCKMMLMETGHIKKNKTIVESRSHAIIGGAWEPTKNAVWKFRNGHGTIEKKYIRMLS